MRVKDDINGVISKINKIILHDGEGYYIIKCCKKKNNKGIIHK